MGISKLIKTLTASDDASLSFVDGTSDVVFDSTYDEYMFVITDINPATDNVDFGFQVNATDDAGGGYDTSLITSSYFDAYHSEAGGSPAVGYEAAHDLAQSATFQDIAHGQGNGADESSASILHIFSPSSTTYVKHFYARSQGHWQGSYTQDIFVSGYINDTTAIDEIRFKMSSGNFDGVIQMFGIK